MLESFSLLYQQLLKGSDSVDTQIPDSWQRHFRKETLPLSVLHSFSPLTLYPSSDSDGNQAPTLRLQESDPAPLLTFLPGHGATQWQHVSLGLRAARTFPEQGVL